MLARQPERLFAAVLGPQPGGGRFVAGVPLLVGAVNRPASLGQALARMSQKPDNVRA